MILVALQRLLFGGGRRQHRRPDLAAEYRRRRTSVMPPLCSACCNASPTGCAWQVSMITSFLGAWMLASNPASCCRLIASAFRRSGPAELTLEVIKVIFAVDHHPVARHIEHELIVGTSRRLHRFKACMTWSLSVSAARGQKLDVGLLEQRRRILLQRFGEELRIRDRIVEIVLRRLGTPGCRPRRHAAFRAAPAAGWLRWKRLRHCSARCHRR